MLFSLYHPLFQHKRNLFRRPVRNGAIQSKFVTLIRSIAKLFCLYIKKVISRILNQVMMQYGKQAFKRFYEKKKKGAPHFR